MTQPLAEAEPTQPSQMDALAAILLRESQCDERTLKRARRVRAETGQRLDTVLVHLGLVSERGLASANGTLLRLPIARPERYALDEPTRSRGRREVQGCALELPNGIVLVTAATGSGETTTLYTGLLTRAVLRRSGPRRLADKVMLRLLLLGRLLREIVAARFTRVLGTLLNNGVALITALSVVRDTLGNAAGAAAVERASARGGGSLTQPLHEARAFPVRAIHLLRLGEENAQLGPMAIRAAEIHEERPRLAMHRLVALLMPAITIVMGVAVAGIRRLFGLRDAEPEGSGEQLMPKRATTGLPAPSGRAAGFTLLEVLIAFIIAGLAIAALMQAVGSGLASSRAAARYQEAVSRARSHLDVAIHGTALVPADTQGDDGGGFYWHLRVTPAASTTRQPPGLARRTATAVTLYAVSVTISWRDGHSTREVRLDSAQVAETWS